MAVALALPAEDDRLEEMRGKTVLVFTPHPDDDLFGAGGTIALLNRKGNKVYVALYTNDDKGSYDPEMTSQHLAHIRKAEEEAAEALLGTLKENLLWMGYDDGMLEYAPQPKLVEEATAVNCRNGDLLAEEQVTANGKEQVLKALGESATKMRQRLGESLASVEKFDAPPENVTTPSLEALQAYSLGCRATTVKTDYAAAIPFFQRALSLDPNFAMAYARLGQNYNNLGETAQAAENARKAYELRERVSEREKFYIESHYEHFVTGDLEAARKIYELWAQTYPRDLVPPVNLSLIYAELGENDKCLAACQEALKLDPGTCGIMAGRIVPLHPATL
jgi:tetratricopeptide (TPR) repeat protein